MLDCIYWILERFIIFYFCTWSYYTICLHFTLTATGGYVFHFNIILFKKFIINFTLYLFYTRPCYILCLNFILTTTHAYAFHSNVIYICLYLHVFLFKDVNIRFMLYSFLYLTILHNTTRDVNGAGRVQVVVPP